MAPSTALQKRASGISSAGAGDHSPNSSSRGGVIRGLLQSIRAGLSTDCSPRSSRTGLGDAPVTPRGSNGQNILAANLDSLRADSDESDDDICKRALSSGLSGRATATIIDRAPLLSESGHIALPLEVPLAASRSYSGRRSGQATPAQSASSARPSFETVRTETTGASGPLTIPSGPRGLSSGPAPVLETPEVDAAVRAAPPQLPSLPSSASAAAQAADTNRQQLAQQQKPMWQAAADAAAPLAAHDAGGPWCALAPGGPEVAPCAFSPPEVQSPATAWARGPVCEVQPAAAPQVPGPRSFQPSIRRRLLEASVALAGPHGAPAGAFAQPQRAAPDSDRSEGSSSNDGDDAGGKAAGVGATAGGGDGHDGAPSIPTVLDPSATQHDDEQHHQNQGQQRQHCRSASSSALSAMAVSQAVHRLQLRQQQEKAAARFARSSAHVPGVAGGGCGMGGGVGMGGLHHQYHGGHQRDLAATAPPQRVLSVTSDSSGGSGSAAGAASGEHGAFAPYGDYPTASSAPAVSGSGSGTSGTPHPHPQQSPARRLGLGSAPSRSAASNHVFQPHGYQHSLYDSHRTAGSTGCAATGGSGKPSPVNRVSRDDQGGLDEWLGDVPDMSRGRVAPTPTSDWCGTRSSVSFTEGHVSAAERLQVMMNSAASIGGDDAASYLQQLLIPEVSSTASVDLQYSTTSTRVPSVVALAYGSSGGPGTFGGPTGGGGGGSVWSLMQTGSSPFSYCGHGEAFPPTSPAAATAAGSGGAHVRHLSAHGQLTGERGSRPSTGGGSSAAGSRHGSMILNSQTAQPLLGGPPSYSSTAMYGTAGSATSGSGVFGTLETVGSAAATNAAASSAFPHANKSAEQLIDQLRELHSSAAASTAAAAEAAAVAAAAGVALAPSPPPPQSHRRDELVAALWRLLRAKDSEAVAYLLAVDPAAKPNRPIAGVLKEMRSWVYLNMW